MAGNILNTSSVIMCPHGGQALLQTSNTRVVAEGAPCLLETDIHPVVGCPFTVGPKYSPCVRLQWSAGTARTKISGIAVLSRSSVGTCFNAEGATQGVAVIANTQTRVSGQ